MSVSHPNCITTYKLSVVRLLRGEGLLGCEQAEAGTSVPPSDPMSLDTEDSAMLSNESNGGRRVLCSLLSGAEAVEVADPYGPLQRGLYETWIVSEVGAGAGGMWKARGAKRG